MRKLHSCIKNYNFVSNRKIKHIKIVYNNVSSKCDEIVLFDEDASDFMNENLTKVSPVFPHVFQDVYATVEIELFPGTYEPWVQIIYEHSNYNPGVLKALARMECNPNTFMGGSHIDIVDGQIYSNIFSLCDIKSEQCDGISPSRALEEKYKSYFYPGVPRRMLCCEHDIKYLGKVTQIDLYPKDLSKSEVYNLNKNNEFYIPQSAGEITVYLHIDNTPNVFCTFNVLYQTNVDCPDKIRDGYYYLSVNGVLGTRYDNARIEFVTPQGDPVDVWERTLKYTEVSY